MGEVKTVDQLISLQNSLKSKLLSALLGLPPDEISKVETANRIDDPVLKELVTTFMKPNLIDVAVSQLRFLIGSVVHFSIGFGNDFGSDFGGSSTGIDIGAY